MPKASPSKAPLPKKPREPKKVKDVAVNTMRVANYQAKLAVYEEEMAAYKVGQRERKVDKRSAQRRLSAGDAEPAAKRPTPVPSSCLLPRASPLAHTPPNPAPPCAHPRHRRTCPPNQARRETPEACAAGSAEAARAPPAKPLRRLPQVLREEKEAAAAAQLRRCDGGAPSKEPCCRECGHAVTSMEAPTRGTCDVCFGRLAAGDDIDVCFRCEPESGSAAGGRWRCRDCRAAAAALAASVAGELPTASASKRQRALYAIEMNMAAAPEREAEAEAEAEAGAGAAQAARAAAEEAAAEAARVRAEKLAVKAVTLVLNRESDRAASEAREAEEAAMSRVRDERFSRLPQDGVVLLDERFTYDLPLGGYGRVKQRVKQTRGAAELAAEAEAAMRAALAAEAVGGLPDGVELFGGPHAEVEYFLAVVLATRAAEYRSECAARAMRQRDPREAEAARAAYPAAEAEAEAARALKAGYEAARLGGRSIRIGTITNRRWCSITGTRQDGMPGRAPRAAIKVSYPNSWFLARESDDEMVARDPCWRRNNYRYSDPRCEYALAVVEALREVDWREEQPLLRDFRHLEDYESAYRAAFVQARAAAEKEAAEVVPLAEAVAPLRILEEVLAQRSQRAEAEEREAQARYKVLRLPWEVKKPLLVALEAAQAEAAPELREESRVLRVMGSAASSWEALIRELREAEAAAEAMEAEATKAEAAVLAPSHAARRLAAALHAHAPPLPPRTRRLAAQRDASWRRRWREAGASTRTVFLSGRQTSPAGRSRKHGSRRLPRSRSRPVWTACCIRGEGSGAMTTLPTTTRSTSRAIVRMCCSTSTPTVGGRQLRSSRLWRGRTAAGGTTGTESSYCTCTCSTTRLMAASFGRLACASRCTLSGQTAGTAPARRSAMSDRDD